MSTSELTIVDGGHVRTHVQTMVAKERTDVNLFSVEFIFVCIFVKYEKLQLRRLYEESSIF